MATGENITTALADALDTVIGSARIVAEQKGVVKNLCDHQRLGEGVGTDWKEIDWEKLTASAISESQYENNPQQFNLTPRTVTPSLVSIQTIITDKVYRNLNKQALAKMTILAQNAVERKIDLDGLTVFDGGTSIGGAGVIPTTGHIGAAIVQITSNPTEPSSSPIAVVLHGYQIHALRNELLAGIGTYPIPEGSTADVFKGGWNLPISNARVFEDGNITIDSSDDAKGGVFAQKGIIYVEGKGPWTETDRLANFGGGASRVHYRAEYAYGTRPTGTLWVKEIYSDAATPSS